MMTFLLIIVPLLSPTFDRLDPKQVDGVRFKDLKVISKLITV